jgi:hypothetical protein
LQIEIKDVTLVFGASQLTIDRVLLQKVKGGKKKVV